MLNYITIFMTTVIGLFLTPIIIKYLGNSEYGLYSLMGAFVGYLTVMDFGLNNSIVRFVSKYQAEKNLKDEENFLSTVMIIYLFICTLIIIISSIIYINFENIFTESLTSEELEKAKLMFCILVLNIVITLPGGSFKAISNAYEHFIFPRISEIIKYLSRSLLVVVILTNGSDAIGLVILDTIANISIIIINAIYVLKVLKIRFKVHSFNKKLTKEVFTYSIWVFVFSIVGVLQWQLGQFLVGINSNTENVAIYSIGVMLGTYYGTFSSAISSVMIPKASKMIINNSSNIELTNMMIKIGRYSFIILMLILGNFILFGSEFIILWVGETYTKAWIIALIIMITYTIPLIQSFANTILEVKALFKFKAIVYIFSITFGAFLGLILLEKSGIEGMILGTSIGWLVGIIIMNFYYQYKICLNIKNFYMAIFTKPFIFFLTILTFCNFINNYFDLYELNSSWLFLLIKIALFSIIYIFFSFFLLLNKNEKNQLKNLIKR
ncbi:oligosaccharide flippase family protein [Arcobacter roscoffensis]|uniref:Oligosaccharide flippase family protein n=1 Tax=Arcobacter roscoffensis TaxID=2961520 RepID=A0ABY5E3T7_9BACT|nr:oligosaccharide flippase family protein [Arcobacter roscoffensis]UTJ05788.1 oligosaccharide flippase family protein [Arcobacter roscoffensis]